MHEDFLNELAVAKEAAEKAGAFLKLNRDNENKIISNFGTFALPKKIIYLSELPKTRSGKILRRILRKISENPMISDNPDMSTILNKTVLNEIKKKMI